MLSFYLDYYPRYIVDIIDTKYEQQILDCIRALEAEK